MYSFTLPLNSALDGSGCLTTHPARFTLGNDMIPTVQEAGWPPTVGLDRYGNISPTGIRSPDRPARIAQSLYRLRYPSGNSGDTFQLYLLHKTRKNLHVERLFQSVSTTVHQSFRVQISADIPYPDRAFYHFLVLPANDGQ
jgi:hypothetical protein